jgi:hypothetical protein
MGAIAGPAAFLLDPLNITGAQDQIPSPQRPRGGDIGNNIGYQAGSQAMAPAPPAPATPAKEQSKLPGFVAGMGGWDDWHKLRAAPSPPKWTYQQGKGAVWSDAQRVGPTDNFAFSPSLDPNKFGGNRF